jgi:UDP-glucose 4-epimerase
MVGTHHQCAGQKVLVTGASGFIGSHLCRSLHTNGAEVHAVSRNQHANGDVHWWQADLADITAVRKLLDNIRPEKIYHLSGHVTAAPDLEFALSTFDSHVISTVYLLTAATEIGCDRIVLTASLTEPQSGCPDAIPGSPYAAAKWASSAYGRMFHALYRTPVTIVRPYMTYGPMQNKQKIIPYVTLSLLRGESPKLASGRWQADWIYIQDVIDGLLAAAQASNVEGCTIDLGSGTLIPVREVVDRVVKLVGGPITPLFGALPDRPAEEIRAADLAYAQNKIGWKPATSLEKGLVRTVAWYQEQVRAAASPFDQKEELR